MLPGGCEKRPHTRPFRPGSRRGIAATAPQLCMRTTLRPRWRRPAGRVQKRLQRGHSVQYGCRGAVCRRGTCSGACTAQLCFENPARSLLSRPREAALPCRGQEGWSCPSPGHRIKSLPLLLNKAESHAGSSDAGQEDACGGQLGKVRNSGTILLPSGSLVVGCSVPKTWKRSHISCQPGNQWAERAHC